MNTTQLPQTVDAIAERIVSLFNDEDKDIVRGVATKQDMIQFHHTAGMTIRNAYNLWIDHPLTEQWRIDNRKENDSDIVVRKDVDDHPCHPDAVSMDILYAVWDLFHKV